MDMRTGKDKAIRFVQFMDMHSGGSRKENFSYLYIETNSEEEACSVFYAKFGHSPNRVTCTCCGEDYSISAHSSLEDATRFERNDYEGAFRFHRTPGKPTPLDEYLADPNVRVIYKDEISDEERRACVPTEGYVWQD